MIKLLSLLVLCFSCAFLNVPAQTPASLLRFPDVSADRIAFSYANDIWVCGKDGGTAMRLTSVKGMESYPKFSPDGEYLAFTANYDGNYNIYVTPVSGGNTTRITYHGYTDRVVDWTPSGDSIIFVSSRESGKQRFKQLYKISAKGGPAIKLPIEYGEFASFSPDGRSLALTFKDNFEVNWKRYRGGWNPGIHIFNLQTLASEDLAPKENTASQYPMWHGNSIYFLSDRGKELRMNIWKYDLNSKQYSQVTNFGDYDVHAPSHGPSDIVFEAGGNLHIMSLPSQQIRKLDIQVYSDRATLKPRMENVEKYMQHASISGDGNRVLVEARGDIFSLPAEKGYVKNLTASSGVADRYPAWSPDGKHIAWWSDASGEYELYIRTGEGAPRKVTSIGPGYRYSLYWSPDSRKLAYMDKAGKIYIVDATSGKTSFLDQGLRVFGQANLEGFSCSWSPDSRYLTWSRDLMNLHSAVFIYDTKTDKKTQVTNGFYDCSSPVFDPEGKYLYLMTAQTFEPLYSDHDNTFIYANSRRPALIPLLKTTASPLLPRNDTVKTENMEEVAEAKPAASKGKRSSKSKVEKAPEEEKNTIDLDGMEARMVMLPVTSGNYSRIAATKGKLIYVKDPNTGSGEQASSIRYYDFEEREEKTVMNQASMIALSADGEKILARSGSALFVVKVQPNQSTDKPVPLGEMQAMVDPAKEWKQIFNDAWRFERDYFYDSAMHGVDWNKVKQQYGAVVDRINTREELNFILGEMIGELNASHTYKYGGDVETPVYRNIGYLGIDWEADNGYYKVKKIIRAAPWENSVRSPLDVPGVNIPEGSYILAVNGIPLSADKEPYASFVNLDNKTVQLTWNSRPSLEGAKTAVVQTIDDEYRLRNLAWIENYRKRVDEATAGQVGYIYVPSTGIDGQNELIRQFLAQIDKKALIIDERFNDGGQIPDRFIEMLERKPLAYWAIRDGKPLPWPLHANFGPKVMLINGWSGSGGDAFPDYFRKRGLGPLIGTRTWGGLIGISGTPDFVDGGGVTVPSFRMYNPDGSWFREGHGVDPDIEVREDLAAFAKGYDMQLERAIIEIQELMKKNRYKDPNRPEPEKR